MAKKTLLELTQAILEDLTGDEVNSINDTVESEQVAGHVRKAYEAIISHTTWPHTRRAVVLVPRSDSDFPTHVTAATNLKELTSIRYNKAKLGETRLNYQEVEYLEHDQFLVKINKRDNTQSNVDIITDDSGIQLLIMNDKAPDYYTSFDDVNIIFDSYDSAVDTTIQQSKLQAVGYIMPEFLMEDSFIPDLPPDAFSLLLEESTSRCQFKMRQFQDIKSENESKKQSNWLSRKAWVVDGGIKYPNYGRKR
jgi:hypothetical protein